MNIKILPFYLIVVSTFFILISPHLLSDGMFMDGLMYAAISKNLSLSNGSLWNLHFSQTLYPSFHEHPPLAFGLQSICFKIFGDNMIVERMYSLGTFFITGIIVNRIWVRITDKEYKNIGWLPLLFWVITPSVFWSASNNMLENTMMIFTSLAVLFFIKGKQKDSKLYLGLAGSMLVFGFLTKGPVALFPLSLVIWYYIFIDNRSIIQSVMDGLFLIIIIVIFYVLLFILVPNSFESLSSYFQKQVIGSISNIKTVDSRFYILWKLLEELLPALVLIALVALISRKKSFDLYSSYFQFFIGLALSGVIPIIISMKQSSFYILPTFPLFSIALALLVAKKVQLIFDRIKVGSRSYTVALYTSLFMFLTSIGLHVLHFNKIGRDKDKLEDIYKIIQIVPKNSILSIEPTLFEDWSLHGYFQRYANISLDSGISHNHTYLITTKNEKNHLESNFIKLQIGLKMYHLLQKVD